MKIIKAGYEILDLPADAREIYRKIERAGRTCYKSEDKITDESAEKFVRAMVKNHHEAMLEHASMTVVFTVDRGISHELVRHRVASFAQESTRYCNYSGDKFGNEITVIMPCFFDDIPIARKQGIVDYCDGILKDLPGEDMTNHERAFVDWYWACGQCENAYFRMLVNGCTPQEARDILPTSVKTEVVVTANMREWRHMLKLRAAGTTGAPHPQMAEVMRPLLAEMKEKLPALFFDIEME